MCASETRTSWSRLRFVVRVCVCVNIPRRAVGSKQGLCTRHDSRLQKLDCFNDVILRLERNVLDRHCVGPKAKPHKMPLDFWPMAPDPPRKKSQQRTDQTSEEAENAVPNKQNNRKTLSHKHATSRHTTNASVMMHDIIRVVCTCGFTCVCMAGVFVDWPK